MKRRLFTMLISLMLAACTSNPKQPSSQFQDDWSKARNITHAAGLDRQIYDQQLSGPAYNEKGALLDYKLAHINHSAYGSSSGVAGVNVRPYGPYENLYLGWTIPGASHLSEHRLFAWMPKELAENATDAQDMLESMLTKASLDILRDMGFLIRKTQETFEHEGIYFKQWYLGLPGESCSLKKKNCILSLYIPLPSAEVNAPGFVFYNVASEPAWLFDARDNTKYARLVLAEGEGKKSISESVFYQKLSARLPGWVYFYMAPNKVGTGDNNKTVPYPYVLEKGRPLLFVRPIK